MSGEAIRRQIAAGRDCPPAARGEIWPMSRTTIAAVIAAAALASPASAAAKSYSPLDEYLLQSSIQGDRFEIAGGKLAEGRGTTPAVRALGTRLVKDHTASLADAPKGARRRR